MRHLYLECRFEAWFVDFRRQIQRQNANTKANAWENGFYALNAAFISWMPLWSVICRFQKANTKAKCKNKGKCIGKWFYALNATFISWMPLWSVICRFQKANTKVKCKCKGKCIGKCFWCPKCGIYILNAALKSDLSISECKYKGKMQMQRQMHGKMVLMP